MEDGVTDTERMVLPSKLSSEVVAHNYEPEKNGKDEAGAGGLISNFISNLVPRSVAESGEEDNGDDTENRNAVSEGKDEEKEGGFINHLISNLVTPLSPRPRKVNEGKVEVENGEKGSDGGGSNSEEGGGGSAGGGGLINDLISNIFNQSDEDGGHKEDSEEEKAHHVGEQNEQVKDKEEGGGGGIINNPVSHLPKSLSENSAPATDEASILIHSIVHD